MAARRVRGRAPALQVRGVSKRYGSLQALDRVSLDLAAGEWIGLLGPNGAGKTSLMHAIVGLLEPDEGGFELLGQPIEPQRSGRARGAIGLVPQEIALYPALTVAENLSVFGLLHGVDRVDLPGRISWALDWTGLSTRAEEPVENLSGGMKRRLNIACAVLHEPRVVVLDEPTVGVDPHGRQRIWSMMAELRRTGVSLIHSSHQLHEIEATCDRILIMDKGRIIAQGRIDQLIEGLAESQRSLRVTFSQPLERMPAGSAFIVDGNAVQGTVHDVAANLRALLQLGQEEGLEILDIQLEAPTLEEVFTHMTGQGLSN